MTRSKGLLLAALMFLGGRFGSDQAFAQRLGTAEGYWKGIVQSANGPKEILVWLNRNGQGAWGGTIDIPAQAVADFPLVVTGEGRTATFRYPGSVASPTFKGTLSADANKLTGDFVEDGKSYPFELTRQSGPPRPAPSPADKALTHARHVLELLRQDKFADVEKDFNAQATTALPNGTLRQRWSALRTQVGEYKSEISHTVDQVANVRIVTLGCQFERGAYNVLVVLADDDKIAGLQFVPRPAK